MKKDIIEQVIQNALPANHAQKSVKNAIFSHQTALNVRKITVFLKENAGYQMNINAQIITLNIMKVTKNVQNVFKIVHQAIIKIINLDNA